jgi:hypothetical protein
MPSDVPVQLVTHAATTTAAPRRLPVGVGLAIGACASLALWILVGIGLRALFT